MALLNTMLNIAINKGAKAISEISEHFSSEEIRAPREYTSLEEKVVMESIASILKRDVYKINLGDRLKQDLGADDYKIINIVRDLEQKFVVTIEDNDIERLRTVEDFVSYISVRL